MKAVTFRTAWKPRVRTIECPTPAEQRIHQLKRMANELDDEGDLITADILSEAVARLTSEIAFRRDYPATNNQHGGTDAIQA